MRSYGSHLRIVEVDGLMITESLRGPQENLPRHSHEFTNVNLVLNGTFRETVGIVQKYCEPNSMVIRPGGEFHSNEYGPEGSHCLIVEILPQRLKMLSELSPVLDFAAYWKFPWLQPQIQRFYHEFQMCDTAALFALDCILLETLSRLSETGGSRTYSKAPSWLLKANEYIQDQFRDPLKLYQIANEVGVHPAHLSKSFRKYFHITPGEMLRNLRLEFAATELVTTKTSLADISLAAGFYDQSHFVKAFKLRYGIPPSEYRRQRSADVPSATAGGRDVRATTQKQIPYKKA
jgi:AraC family transcriptional regulator